MAFDPLTLRRAHTEYLGVLGPLVPGTRGHDLGVSFERDDRVVFLFGDALADATHRHLQDVDFAASAPCGSPSTELEWIGPLAPRGLALPRMGVPVEGLVAGADTYVFFATGFDERRNLYGISALTKTSGLALDRLRVVDETSAERFANVSVVMEGDDAFVFGTGNPYRGSAIRVARVPLARIEDRESWIESPAPVADVRDAGELSVRRHPELPLHLMAYATGEPRGIALRLARSPLGPWVPAGLLFDPIDGYGRFMHAKESAVGFDDGLAQPGDEETWGGEYGPYLVPSWFAREGDAIGIVFTLSSWNPYRVHLLRTWLVPPGVVREAPQRGLGLPPPRVADGAFAVDSRTRTLTFTIVAGRGTVALRRGEHIVRTSRGRGFLRHRFVRWHVEEYRGEVLRFEVNGVEIRDLRFE